MKLQFAQRTELALRALRTLETRGDTARAIQLAPLLNTTPQYLPVVLRPLVNARWIESQPGPSGGYRLATDLGGRSLLEFIDVMEGPTDTRTCVLRRSDCDETHPCALHDTWVSVREALVSRLANIPVSGRGEEQGS